MIGNKQREMVQRLGALVQQMEQQGDTNHRLKLLELMRKVHKNEFILAFCGHFSAGKSTMLNELYGEDLLPTSPIPTSANIVKIQAGPERVTLFLSSGEKYTYEGSYTEKELKQLCKNGEEVIAVHVFKDKSNIPEGISFLDTPGIDSTDDAHRMATESALHLADVIFYMMDYNHVQSEENYLFIKELTQRNKCVYLVINQIDKHREEELPFSAYQASVEESFQNWNLQVEGIFYTSLRNRQHSQNQLDSFKQFIQQLIEQRQTLLLESAYHEAEYLIKEHLRYIEERDKPRVKKLQAQLVDETDRLTDIEQKLTHLKQQQEQIKQQRNEIGTKYKKQIESILQNAYLMPYEVRELAEQYLESIQPHFKVGFLFSKSKTEQEKARRKQAFFDKLAQIVKTQLDTHVKQAIHTFFKEQQLDSEEVAAQIYQSSISLSPGILEEMVKTGAGLSGNYLLQYCEDLANELKRRYRQWSQQIYDMFKDRLEARYTAEISRLGSLIQQWERALAAGQELMKLKQDQETYHESLVALLNGKQEGYELDLETWLTEEPIQVRKDQWISQTSVSAAPVEEEKPLKEEAASPSQEISEQIKGILDRVDTVTKLIDGLTGLESIRKELITKRKRVANRQFTVALFGAFSAGKSSFANALIGESILPVSPNPTTATITKVCPPTEKHHHGQAVVYFKSREALLQDLQYVFQLFQRKVNTLEEAIRTIPDLLQISEPNARQKMSFAFLRAVRNGYPAVQEKLGSSVSVTVDEWSEYVANEEKSCFVELAELYYDCLWTRYGITLVDTPGADSINARHTGVAFEYIRDADAILYVTYYNHAFSRADREFLIQLGRVKDTFSMDKMFFIMNAADLASSEEELEAVQQYLKEQLLQYGIRHPRMFAVSSLLALREKQGIWAEKNSGMEMFEKAFTSFIMRDLLLVSLRQLVGNIERAKTMLANFIRSTLQSHEEKEAKKKQVSLEQAQVSDVIKEWNASAVAYALDKEIEELLYYVKQRVFLRYNDVFIEIFNPGTLRGDLGQIKQKLYDCLLELLDFIRHDVMQELRATSLRLEKWLDKKLMEQLERMVAACKQINGELPFSVEIEHGYTTPTFLEPFPSLDLSAFKKALSHFKNAKSFFEKNERASMRDEVKKILEQEVESYIKEQKERLFAHYREEWQDGLTAVKQKVSMDCQDYYQSMMYILSEQIDVAHLKLVEAKVKEQYIHLEKDLDSL